MNSIKKDDFMKQFTSALPIGLYDTIKDKVIGIAGAGGLGSNIAVALVRTGLTKIIIADFDRVEFSNLNRQYYFYSHVGEYKVDALKEQLERINPFVEITTSKKFLDRTNFSEIFKNCDIVVEAFDNAESKSEIIDHFISKGKTIFSGVGMAGIYSANIIKTKKLGKNLYLSGDFINEANSENGLIASRVAVAANHEANMIIRFLYGETEV